MDGYSIDNIHPSVPAEMFVSTSEQDINISWDYSEDIDFAYHMVSDIDRIPNYTIDNNISITLNTSYNEYHKNSIDINGNVSEDSEYISAYNLRYNNQRQEILTKDFLLTRHILCVYSF